jgi:cell division protein FtsB
MDYNTWSTKNLILKIEALNTQNVELIWSKKVLEDQLENLKWDRDSAQRTIRKLRDQLQELME